MNASIASPLPPMLPTTARAGSIPVEEPAVRERSALSRGLARAADIVGIILLGLLIPAAILIVGMPVALAVRGLLYLLGQL
jgi:hypothetical protein